MDRPLENYQVTMFHYVGGERREQVVSIRDLAYAMRAILAFSKENARTAELRRDYVDQLEALDAETERLRDALGALRAAWNAHMDGCPVQGPTIEPPSETDLAAWRDAPSGTASA